MLPILRMNRLVFFFEKLSFVNKIFREYREHYLGDLYLPEKMNHLNIGSKQTTGVTRNENGYTQTFNDPHRFLTTYQIKYKKIRCF